MSDALAAVRRTFSRHHDYWAGVRGVVNRQLEGTERALTMQYAGRVPFELLQNALDRCREFALLRLCEDVFIVGNDAAEGLSVNPDFDHERDIGEDNPLSDFHALCSVHTSNKSPDEHYGNKGVGFRSVFSVADRVQVWTRLRDDRWWGLELHRCLNGDLWRRRLADPAVARGHRELLEGDGDGVRLADGDERPSWHFPIPLLADEPPVLVPDRFAGLDTLVLLPLDDDEARARVRVALERLTGAHLDFVGLRKDRLLEVVVDGLGEEPLRLTATGTEEGGTLGAWSSDESSLTELARKAGLDIHSVSCAVRLPPSLESRNPRPDPLLYCYLPSEVRAEFGADVHADFQLGIDRKHLELKPEEAAGKYNRELIAHAMELHLQLVLRQLGIPVEELGPWERIAPDDVSVRLPDGGPRPDIWGFLDPQPRYFWSRQKDERVRAFVEVVKGHLFPRGMKHDEAWERWAGLAAAYFDGRGPRPVVAYSSFWRATQNWLETEVRQHYQDAERIARRGLAALREAGARVVPLTWRGARSLDPDAELEGCLPPAPGRAAGRASFRLFQILGDDDGAPTSVEVPRPIRERGREVTAWRFPATFRTDRQRLLFSTPFDRTSLLQELRQVPNAAHPDTEGTGPLAEFPEDARARQYGLLEFAARLFVLEVPRGQVVSSYQDDEWAPGWRACETSKDLAQAGRAVATLFLPTRRGDWEPARQCRRDDLDPRWLDALSEAVPDLDVSRFLRFLGVATWEGSLLLVEDGEQGLDDPRSVPPTLCDPGNLKIPDLRVVLAAARPEAEPGFVDRVQAAWDAGWLQGLARKEALSGRSGDDEPDVSGGRLAVMASLGERPWYPVAEDEARPPEACGSERRAVAPERLTFERTFNRQLQVLWRIRPQTEERKALLSALGAQPLDKRIRDAREAERLVRALRESYPDPEILRGHPQARKGLVELFQRAMDTLARSDEEPWPDDLPLLYHAPDPDGEASLHARTLRWGDADDVRIAASNADRNDVRRLFPQLPLLCAAIGPKQLDGAAFQHRGIVLRDRIRFDRVLDDDAAARVRSEVEGLLPQLLAMAEASRRYVRMVPVEQVRRRWSSTRLVHVHDVWREVSLDGELRHEQPRFVPHAGPNNDVMEQLEHDDQRSVVGATVYFDVKRDGSGAPPLPYFAASLARALLDGTVEPDWRAVLHEYEAGGAERLDDYLTRRGAGDLVEDFRQQWRPLSDAHIEEHRRKVAAALEDIGLHLVDPGWSVRAGTHLGREDLAGDAGGLREEDVRRALEAAPWSPHERDFVPVFSCRNTHRAVWEAWTKEAGRLRRLLRFAHDVRRPGIERPRDRDLLQGELHGELKHVLLAHLPRLDFEPEGVVRAWLGVDAPAGPVDAWLPPLISFRPVVDPPRKPRALRGVAMDAAATVAAELAPESADRRRLANEARATKGDGAEEGLLAWVVGEVARHLEGAPDAAWDALMSALPDGGRLWASFDQARTDEAPDLAGLLHVSRRWGSAGFDLLGLERGEGGLEPVRYEVKAIPEVSGRVRVFLSRNELAVCRSCNGPDGEGRFARGRWALVGVTHDGDARDLTDALGPVMEPGREALAELASHGFRPESLELTLELGEEPATP